VAVAAGAGSVSDSAAGAAYRPTAARTPTPRPSSTPTAARATSVGAAGVAPRFYVADAAHMLLVGASAGYQTQDGGTTWTKLPPAPGTTMVADTGAAGRLLSAGSDLSTSTTAGHSWQKVNITPPVAGPYTALAINPDDSAVWFIAAQGHLLRTRDAGVSWRQGLNGLPATLDKPVMRPAAAKDSFLLASGPHVYLLKENGQALDDLGALPAETAISDLGDLGSSIYAARAPNGHVYVYKGATWRAVSPRLDGPLGATGGHLLVADGGASLGKPGSLALSLDGGATWLAATDLPADQSIEAVAYAPDGTAIAYGYAGDFFTSSDGGHAWRLLSTALRST
jgi:photosystem II stability/assembly factor-like uncharacterized protein